MNSYNTDDIIYALATGWNKSAIAVIRVSGDSCIGKLEQSFSCKGKLSDYPSNSAVYGHLVNNNTKAKLDDCIITVFKDKHGYTGEESLEISCHGGLETVKSILTYLQSIGFREAGGGEFTFRAFLHGKMDLTKAEAVNELINSRGNEGRLMALNRLSGALFNRINEIKSIILDVMSTVEVQLDYSEDEIGEDLSFPFDKLDKACEMLNGISCTYNTGRLYSQGAMIVLAGSANAGKSSLFNLFLKEERAIVSPIKGTTRDYLEAECSVNGIPVRLFDTAGLRESNDVLEEEGIRRSHSLLDGADLIVYLIDASDPEIEEKITSDSRCITVVNKTDLNVLEVPGAIGISAKTGEGFDRLVKEIEGRLKKDMEIVGSGGLVIENQRQKDNLERAKSALQDAVSHVKSDLPLDIVTMDIQDALEALGEITGEVTTDDILDKIFSGFCVGK